MATSCTEQVRQGDTIRVTRYDPLNAEAIPITLLSSDFVILEDLSQIKQDRVSVIDDSENEAGFVEATVNLEGLGIRDPVLTYVYLRWASGKPVFITVNHIFLALPEQVIVEIFNAEYRASPLNIPPGQTNILWNRISVGESNYDSTNGRLSYRQGLVDATVSLSGSLSGQGPIGQLYLDVINVREGTETVINTTSFKLPEDLHTDPITKRIDLLAPLQGTTTYVYYAFRNEGTHPIILSNINIRTTLQGSPVLTGA